MPPAVTEERDRPQGQLDVDAELVEDISALIDTDQRGMVMNLVADLYPADLSSLLAHLPLDEAKQLFHWLPIEDAGEVIAELDGNLRAALLEQVQPARLTALLDELDTDDAADVLSELPDEVAQTVLPHLEDAADVEELLGYAEDTAGGIMGTEYVAVHAQWTVADATEAVRRNAERIEEIFGVFVVDEEEHLLGTVSLKRLLLSPSHASVSSIMDTDTVSVETHVDQEEVARIMQRYDLVSLPVVDAQNRLVGRITIDDIVDVIREEAEEDLQLMSGVSGGEEHSHSIIRVSRGRLPWLLTGLAGAGLSGFVIGTFEEDL
ncbi:MAG TPA: magnesium transporter, partial [Rhodothermales bacterium]